jgi:hypothetical protein
MALEQCLAGLENQANRLTWRGVLVAQAFLPAVSQAFQPAGTQERRARLIWIGRPAIARCHFALSHLADWKVGDTADWKVCATLRLFNRKATWKAQFNPVSMNPLERFVHSSTPA